jgi:membrane protein YdbS with pleckstrin-like domain
MSSGNVDKSDVIAIKLRLMEIAGIAIVIVAFAYTVFLFTGYYPDPVIMWALGIIYALSVMVSAFIFYDSWKYDFYDD